MLRKFSIIILAFFMLFSCEFSQSSEITDGNTPLPDNPAVIPDPEEPEENDPATPVPPAEEGNKTLSDSKARYYLNIAIGEYPIGKNDWEDFIDGDEITFTLEEYPVQRYSDYFDYYYIYINDITGNCEATINEDSNLISSAYFEDTDNGNTYYIAGQTIGSNPVISNQEKIVPSIANLIIEAIESRLYEDYYSKHLTSFTLTRDAANVNYFSFDAENTKGALSHYNVSRMITKRSKASATSALEEKVELVISNSFETISISAAKQEGEKSYTILSATVS